MVVREDLSVVCYDHELRRLWNKELKHEALPGDFASYVMDQVSSLLPLAPFLCPACFRDRGRYVLPLRWFVEETWLPFSLFSSLAFLAFWHARSRSLARPPPAVGAERNMLASFVAALHLHLAWEY